MNPLPLPSTHPSHRETRKPRLPANQRALRRRTLGWASALLSLLSALQANAEPFGLQLRDSDGGWLDSLALETSVDMQVTGLLAEVTVTQRYRNDGTQWQEGRYLLPLPDDAAVGRLRIRIGERLIEGEVREKQQAQQLYQQAADNGQVAALVEQQRRNLFSTAVANIAPGDTVDIEIGYWQPVSYRDGEFSLALPLTLTPRYRSTGSSVDNAITLGPASAVAAAQPLTALPPTVSLQARVVPGVALASMRSTTHAVDVHSAVDGYHVRLRDLVDTADRDFELRWKPLPSAEPQRALFAEEVDGETYAMLMLLPPSAPVAALPRELLVVVDCSGSMLGTSMQQAIAALDHALARLRPDERFNIVRFSDTAQSFAAQSLPASADNLRRAREWVAGLQAEGGTEMAPALRLAFGSTPADGYLRQLVLLTDAAIGNENELLSQIEQQRGDSRVFPVGIGSAPNTHFIRRVAQIGRGSFELVRDIAEVEARMGQLLDRIDRPLLSDLAVHWPGSAQSYPERLPDLYAGEPLQLLVRLDALQGEVQVSGLMKQSDWHSSLPLALEKRARLGGIGRLWARARIDALEDSLRLGMDPLELQQQITATALQHGLASRYTSLVAVEQVPARPAGSALASSVIDNAAPAGSLAFAQGATSARSRIGYALALLLMTLALLHRRESPKPPGLA